MKKYMLSIILAIGIANNCSAQVIDWSKINLNGLVSKVLTVRKGWAPQFTIGTLPIKQISKVATIINLKNVAKATKLFNTFKTGRTLYKIGAYAGLGVSTYSTIKNLVQSNKEATTQALNDARAQAISKAQNLMIAGGATIGIGVLVKLLTKQAAYEATEAFNGVVKRKLKDILSLDVPTYSPYITSGIALKVKL